MGCLAYFIKRKNNRKGKRNKKQKLFFQFRFPFICRLEEGKLWGFSCVRKFITFSFYLSKSTGRGRNDITSSKRRNLCSFKSFINWRLQISFEMDCLVFHSVYSSPVLIVFTFVWFFFRENLFIRLLRFLLGFGTESWKLSSICVSCLISLLFSK